VLSEPKPQNEKWAWLGVAVWTAVIYVSIFLARGIQQFVAQHGGRQLFGYTVLAVIVLAGGGALVYLRLAKGAVPKRNVAWLAAIVLVYAALTYRLRGNPEEALHFIQYGVLGLLMWRALSYRMRDNLIYLCAGLGCALVGTVDECIQWVTPERYFDFRDVRLNAYSGALMQLAIAAGLRPGYIRGRASLQSVRWTCGVASAELVLLGLCLSNTPERVERYATQIPGLDALRRNKSVMNEFGFRHQDPEAGTFFCRLTLAELKQEDMERGAAVAKIIDTYVEPERYDKFLSLYTPGVDPFTHEACVHLYRRNAYIRAAREWRHDTERYRELLTVAHRENLILEKHFTRTIAHSKYALSPEGRARLERYADPNFDYVSPVSAQMVTFASEIEIWSAIVACIFLLFLVRQRYGRAVPRESSVSG